MRTLKSMRLRLALTCLLVPNRAPEIFILDEPTNNLDLESVDILVASLNHYCGNLVVIFHGEHFLDNMGIDVRIFME